MAYIILVITGTSKPAPQTSILSLGGASLHLVKLQLYSNQRILIEMCRLFVSPTSTPRSYGAAKCSLTPRNTPAVMRTSRSWMGAVFYVPQAPIRVVTIRQEIGSFRSLMFYLSRGALPFLPLSHSCKYDSLCFTRA